MNASLRLIKGKDNFGIYAYGICKVISHKNCIVTEIEPNEYGQGMYRFKVVGASRQITDRLGNQKWLRQKLFCSVNKDSIWGNVAKDLNYGDIVEILGVLKSSTFTTDTGKQRKTSFCNLCKLTVVVKSNDIEKDNTIELDEEEDALFDDDDF